MECSFGITGTQSISRWSLLDDVMKKWRDNTTSILQEKILSSCSFHNLKTMSLFTTRRGTSFGRWGSLDFFSSASDSSATRSIVKMKAGEDKQKVVSKHVVMAYSGEPGGSWYAGIVFQASKLLLTVCAYINRGHGSICWICWTQSTSLRNQVNDTWLAQVFWC